MQWIGATKESGRTLESDTAAFLLFVAGLLFFLEGIIHYDDFFVSSQVSATATTWALVLGNLVVGLLYFALAYSCLQAPKSEDLFGFSLFFSGTLSGSYIAVEIVESVGPKFYFAEPFNYIHFVIGYGSVTIFVELLVAFFCYRVFRTLAA